MGRDSQTRDRCTRCDTVSEWRGLGDPPPPGWVLMSFRLDGNRLPGHLVDLPYSSYCSPHCATVAVREAVERAPLPW